MPLTPGTKLGPYEIIAPLGAGGMGEVYRARDSRLDRTVAIKILPPEFAADPERVRRFEQESRSVAALSHPNVVAIYDVGTQDGLRFLVTEFLEGKTLRERLQEGSLSVNKAVDYGLQIARGLAGAHERGIVHRDLKPENVFITRDGHAKLLDFGLARVRAASDNDKTIGSQTSPGVVMGTAGYMSPEQVRGEAVDHRTDIFSFGAVLYEMLDGKRAFTGDTSVEVMTAILKSEPAQFDGELKVSPGLERIIRHCLEKSPNDRFQTARDLSFALEALSGTDSSSANRAVHVSSRPRWMGWAVGGIAVLALAALAFLSLRPGTAIRRMQFAIPVQGEKGYIAISQDGEMLAYVSPDENTGAGVLYIQKIGGSEATHVQGSEGATYPFFSPDHRYVAFFAAGKLKEAPTSGGLPENIAPVSDARGGTWGSKNIIVYAPASGGPLWRVNSDGSGAAVLTSNLFEARDSSHRFPVFLPDGDHFLFWGGSFDEKRNDNFTGIYLSSLAADKKVFVTEARSNIGYMSATRSVVYANDQNALVAASFDPKSGKLTGQPRVIAPVVGRFPSTYWATFSVSDNGTVVYGTEATAFSSQLTWYDRKGKQLGTVGDPGILANPMISPDQTKVAVDVADIRSKNIDVWIQSLTHNSVSRFTFDPAEETIGAWSRDGSLIAWRSAGEHVLSVKSAGALQAEKVLLPAPQDADTLPTCWTPDDKQIMLSSQLTHGGDVLELVSMDGKRTPFLQVPGSVTNGQISPDGKWVAYASNESGDWEVYATTFPTPSGKLQISRGGGIEPRWRGDGKEIFYIGPSNVLNAVSLTESDGNLSMSMPQALFQTHGRAPVSSTDLFSYDVTKDGNRFLVNRYLKPAYIEPLKIILNAESQP
jgi:eukaryotic-like serine/threonine-protein kinase